MKRIAVLNQKGGSGKTTTVCNLGAALADLGKRVLLVDVDPQGHLTQSLLGSESRDLEKSIHHVLTGEISFKEVAIERGEFSIAPSTLDLAAVDAELSTVPGKEFLLREALSGLRGDFCFIDCPPSLGLLTIMALTASHALVIPLQAEFLALDSVSKMLTTIELIKKRLNPKLEIAGVVATRVDHRKRLNREIMGNAKSYFKDKMFKTAIRENISLAEAPSYGKTIFEYAPRSHGAADYQDLAKEFLKREVKK